MKGRRKGIDPDAQYCRCPKNFRKLSQKQQGHIFFFFKLMIVCRHPIAVWIPICPESGPGRPQSEPKSYIYVYNLGKI